MSDQHVADLTRRLAETAIERNETVKRLRAALEIIATNRGHCSQCGTLAGAGVIKCTCKNGWWEPPNVRDTARKALEDENDVVQ